jgi:tetratricopeptide (TPR) repeat protein
MNLKPLVYSLLIALPLRVFAGEFEAANALYDAGKFAEAADRYAKVEPRTAHVLFNLGNALYRQDKLGQAVLSYERARHLAPRDPDILANLRFARARLGLEETQGPKHPVRRFLANIVDSRTLNEWSMLELCILWLTLAAAAGCILIPKWRTGIAAVAIAFSVSWLAVTGVLAAKSTAPPEAVVLAAKADARFAPLNEATVHFTLPEGAAVAIREDRGPWVLVERQDGQQGWLPRATIEPV